VHVPPPTPYLQEAQCGAHQPLAVLPFEAAQHLLQEAQKRLMEAGDGATNRCRRHRRQGGRGRRRGRAIASATIAATAIDAASIGGHGQRRDAAATVLHRAQVVASCRR
jgi:hypothetical protein